MADDLRSGDGILNYQVVKLFVKETMEEVDITVLDLQLRDRSEQICILKMD